MFKLKAERIAYPTKLINIIPVDGLATTVARYLEAFCLTNWIRKGQFDDYDLMVIFYNFECCI